MGPLRALFLVARCALGLGLALFFANSLIGANAKADDKASHYPGRKKADRPIERKELCGLLPIKKVILNAEARGKISPGKKDIKLIHKEIAKTIYAEDRKIRRFFWRKRKNITDYYEWPALSVSPEGKCAYRIEVKRKVYNISTEFGNEDSGYNLRAVCISQEFHAPLGVAFNEHKSISEKYAPKCFDWKLHEKNMSK